MGKILFWFVVITAVLLAARLLARGGRGPDEGKASGRLGRGEAGADTPDMSHAEAMVRCEHCGIHLPRSEAFLSNGRIWCGPEHARLGQHTR